jgi:protein SCO1
MVAASAAVLLPSAIWVNRHSANDALTMWSAAPTELQPILWPEPRPVSEFTLENQHGDAFTHTDLQGRWSFLFFGYLECPDVCPTTLHVMRELRAQLEASGVADDYQFVFISVDPGRDTPARIGSYLDHFDSAFVGVSGPAPELERLARSVAVKYVEVVDADSGSRAIDHTSSLLVVDPLGRITAAFPPPHRPDRMRGQFEQLRRYTRL